MNEVTEIEACAKLKSLLDEGEEVTTVQDGDQVGRCAVAGQFVAAAGVALVRPGVHPAAVLAVDGGRSSDAAERAIRPRTNSEPSAKRRATRTASATEEVNVTACCWAVAETIFAANGVAIPEGAFPP